MPSDEQYGVLLFDDAYEHLDEALKHYVQTGPIGKIIGDVRAERA